MAQRQPRKRGLLCFPLPNRRPRLPAVDLTGGAGSGTGAPGAARTGRIIRGGSAQGQGRGIGSPAQDPSPLLLLLLPSGTPPGTPGTGCRRRNGVSRNPGSTSEPSRGTERSSSSSTPGSPRRTSACGEERGERFSHAGGTCPRERGSSSTRNGRLVLGEEGFLIPGTGWTGSSGISREEVRHDGVLLPLLFSPLPPPLLVAI